MTRWDWSLAPSPRAPSEARGHVRGALEHVHAASGLVDDAVLLVSEVVSNAVEHGHGGVALSVLDVPGGWQVRVHDDSRERPLVRGGDLCAEGGRGLVLVDALAQDWGTDHIPSDGKVVWFTLALSPGP